MIDCRNIVSELIKFCDCIMNWMEVEVGCNVIWVHIICRMLYRAEIVNIVCSRYNNHTAGVLTCGSLNSRTTDCKTLFLSLVHYKTSLLCKLLNEAECCFFGYCRNCSRFEHIILTEELFRVTVRFWLILTAEVKVDIRHFVAFKAKKCFKRNFVTFLIHKSTAFGTVFWRHIKAWAVTTVCDELAVFAVWTYIVRTKRINLRNTGHSSYEGRTYRSSWTDKISVCLTVCNKLLRSHIKHGESIGCDWIKFLVKSCLYDFRQWITVFLFCSFPCNVNKLFLCALNVRRECTLWNRSDIFAHIGDFIGIFYYILIGFILTEPFKFLEHFSSCSEIKRSLLFGIFKALTCHKNFSEFGICRIHKVDIAGCAYRLAEFFCKLNYCTVNFMKFVNRIKSAVTNHKAVIACRLNFKIIIEWRILFEFAPRLALKNCHIKLTCTTSWADYESLSVLHKLAFGNSRLFVEIIKMTVRNKSVKIFKTCFILYKNNLMIGRKLFKISACYLCINVVCFCYTVIICKSLTEIYKNSRKHFGIIGCSVVIEVAEP